MDARTAAMLWVMMFFRSPFFAVIVALKVFTTLHHIGEDANGILSRQFVRGGTPRRKLCRACSETALWEASAFSSRNCCETPCAPANSGLILTPRPGPGAPGQDKIEPRAGKDVDTNFNFLCPLIFYRLQTLRAEFHRPNANLKAERCILHPRPRRTALPRLRCIPSQSAILRHKISGLPCNSQRINDLPVCDECIALFTIASQPHRVKGFAPRETLRPAIVPLKRLSIPPQTPAPCRRR